MTGVVTFGLPTMNSLVFAQRAPPGVPRRCGRSSSTVLPTPGSPVTRTSPPVGSGRGRERAIPVHLRLAPDQTGGLSTVALPFVELRDAEACHGRKACPQTCGTRLSSLILCPTEGKCCRRPRASLLSMTALVVARAASWAGPWRYRRAGDAYATANPLTKVHPDRTRPAFGSGARFRASVGRRRPPDLNFR